MVAPNRGEAAVYLQTLELNPRSPVRAGEIKKQWKALCKRFHPDKHTEIAYAKFQENFKKSQEDGVPFDGEYVLSPEEAQAKFIEVTHAYKMLTDREYAFKEKFKDSPIVDLNVQIPFGVSFDEAFFGINLVLNVAVREYDEDGRCLNEGENAKPFSVETLEVEVRAGTFQAENIVIKNKGCICGKKRGNIHLTVIPQPSSKFKMDGKGNVVSEIQIPLHVMLKGGTVDVPTMYGVKTINVPAGTNPGEELPIKNCGVEEQGKHLAQVMVPKFPKKGELKDNPDWDGLGFNFDIEGEVKDEEESGFQNIFIKLQAGHGSTRAGW